MKNFIESQETIHQKMVLSEEIQLLNLLHHVDLGDDEIEQDMKKWRSRFSFKHIGSEWL